MNSFPSLGFYLKAFKVEPQSGLEFVNPCVTFDINRVYLSKQRNPAHKEAQITFPPPEKTNINAT